MIDNLIQIKKQNVESDYILRKDINKIIGIIKIQTLSNLKEDEFNNILNFEIIINYFNDLIKNVIYSEVYGEEYISKEYINIINVWIS